MYFVFTFCTEGVDVQIIVLRINYFNIKCIRDKFHVQIIVAFMGWENN